MARTIKDVFCRYKTQQGYLVHRKAGWDTHGLPVELGVEKKLGITKEDIGKKISIEEYNRTCHEAVMEFTGKWEDLTRKMGYWVNMDDPYITYDNKYIETLWWLLKQLFDKGLLYKGYTIQPYSPAAGTGLSTHELNQPGCYRDVKDTTCTSQFRVIRDAKSEKLFEGVEGELYFLAWTTTPWTLPSNTAVSLGPDIDYCFVEADGKFMMFAKDMVEAVAKVAGWESYRIVEANGEPVTMKGDQFGDITYICPVLHENTGRIIWGEHVTLDAGTGAVHTAPGHGVDDYKVGMKFGVDTIMPIDDDGRFTDYVPQWAGLTTDEANPKIIEWLREQGTLVAHVDIVHSYPHCWRCHEPVIFRATDQWFVSMDNTGLREAALDQIHNHVEFIPEWGVNRIGAMVADRPDCASRASAAGACRFPCSSARAAARPLRPKRPSTRLSTCSTPKAPTHGSRRSPRNTCPRARAARSAAAPTLCPRKISSTYGGSRACRTWAC